VPSASSLGMASQRLPASVLHFPSRLDWRAALDLASLEGSTRTQYPNTTIYPSTRLPAESSPGGAHHMSLATSCCRLPS